MLLDKIEDWIKQQRVKHSLLWLTLALVASTTAFGIANIYTDDRSGYLYFQFMVGAICLTGIAAFWILRICFVAGLVVLGVLLELIAAAGRAWRGEV